MHIRTLHVLLLVLMHDHQICAYHVILTGTTGLAVHHARTCTYKLQYNFIFWGNLWEYNDVFLFILLLALIVALKQGSLYHQW
jgi:hypothetical protein